MNLLVHFVIYGHSWCFESSQIALAYGSCNFENFQNITHAHKSRNALAFIRFPILIIQNYILRNIFCVPQWWQLIWLDNKNYKVCRLNNLFNKACNTVHVTDHECVFQFLVLVEFMYCSSIIFFFYESFQLKPVIKGKEIKLWNLFQHLFSFF